MKIRSVLLFLFVVILAPILCSYGGAVDHLKFFPKRYSNYLGCFFDVTPCDRLDLVLKNALTPYFNDDLAHYGVVMKVFIKTQFSHLKKYYPEEWIVIEEIYNANKLQNNNNLRLHKPKKLFFKSMDRDYKNHAYERLVADCLVNGNNQCRKLIKEFRDTMLNFLELGLCVGCNRYTFDWFNSIKNVLEANYSIQVHEIIIADYKGNYGFEIEADAEPIEEEKKFVSKISSIEILNKRYPNRDNSYESTAIDCFLHGSSYCDTMIKTFKKNAKIFLSDGTCSRSVTCKVFSNAARIAEKNHHEALLLFIHQS